MSKETVHGAIFHIEWFLCCFCKTTPSINNISLITGQCIIIVSIIGKRKPNCLDCWIKINKILPETGEGKTAESGYYTNLEAANAKIQELEKKLAATTSSDTMNADEIEQLKKENARLKKFEDDRNSFAKRQSEFQKNVLFASGKPDTEEYKKYYSEIGEDNAEKIFKLVAKNYIYQQELSDQADILAKMQPANAAKTLTEMTGDLQLIADILNKMQASKRAPIMDQMESTVVAQIETKLSKG